jgi:hypothetical protein
MSTVSPNGLKAARLLLLEHLDGLTSTEVGIVGDTAHAAGGDSYHLGKSQIRARAGRDRYSVDESPRDKAGLTDAASALDVGQFSHRAGGRTHTLQTFSAWLVAQCKAGAADTRDIREVIYSPDGSTVRRWDRLGRRSTGDSSHTFHTHISYFRDSESRDKTALFRRYLTEIGILEDDVALTDADKKWLAAEIDKAATAAAERVWKVQRNIGGPGPAYLAPLGDVLANMPFEHGAMGQKLDQVAKAIGELDAPAGSLSGTLTVTGGQVTVEAK